MGLETPPQLHGRHCLSAIDCREVALNLIAVILTESKN
jgi:hypothetical protein